MASPNIEKIFQGTLDLSGWKQFSGKVDYPCEDVPVPGLDQKAYERVLEGSLVSVGVFHYNGTPAFIAWGIKSDKHCGFHALLLTENKLSETRVGCPDVKLTKNKHGEVIGFILDGTESFTSS